MTGECKYTSRGLSRSMFLIVCPDTSINGITFHETSSQSRQFFMTMFGQYPIHKMEESRTRARKSRASNPV
jgi:hypothetical protein